MHLSLEGNELSFIGGSNHSTDIRTTVKCSAHCSVHPGIKFTNCWLYRLLYRLQNFQLFKIYAKYMLLVPRSRCILYCDFNINNAFKCSLFPSSVLVYYSTENCGLHFLKLQENYSILSLKYYWLKLIFYPILLFCESLMTRCVTQPQTVHVNTLITEDSVTFF